MHVRVVRFTDVTPERVEQIVAAINEADGPPPGVPATGLQLLFDEAQRTAVVLQMFDTAEDMSEAAKAFSAMDPSDTPGTRVSVDMCELTLDRHVTG
ncbi:MAG: hypothetical protein WAN22_22675 [Solirubrobacteraceae bacterium]